MSCPVGDYLLISAAAAAPLASVPHATAGGAAEVALGGLTMIHAVWWLLFGAGALCAVWLADAEWPWESYVAGALLGCVVLLALWGLFQ